MNAIYVVIGIVLFLYLCVGVALVLIHRWYTELEPTESLDWKTELYIIFFWLPLILQKV